MITEVMKNKALAFIQNHKDDAKETQEAQQFMRDFIDIFNPAQARVGFEYQVNVNGSPRRIDYLWPGVLLCEMKGRGIDFDKLEPGHTTSPLSQAERYYQHLDDRDKPNYLMLCNFETIRLIKLESQETIDFATVDLLAHLDDFDFLLGQKKARLTTDNIDPVNAKAAMLLETIHSQLLSANYPRNYADLLMTRLVFCLFADDTQIFRNGLFQEYIQSQTLDDGSDLVNQLSVLFQVLDTPETARFQTGLLAEFPYINGGLFKLPQLSGLALTQEIRDNLLEISTLNWRNISPVIFGSMFEGAMDKEKRHNLGAHYTSEKNILKVTDSLFMDDLRAEFEQIKTRKTKREEALQDFHRKLASLKFLDPACGSGNFLIVAYRELRRLEHDVIDSLVQGQISLLEISDLLKVEVSQFYGIEINAYATSIARLGLWLMDHIMNLEASSLFGSYYVRLPLHTGGNIAKADALAVDWLEVFDTEEFVSADKIDFVLGNPPFIGNRVSSSEQKASLVAVTKTYTKAKALDFVSGWYFKAAELMQKFPNLQATLVSTNSVVQGTQATDIWQPLFEKLNVKINFAHQTFKWDNNGAAVFVVIIGFALFDKTTKNIFEYEDIKGEAVKVEVQNINQNLLPAPTVFVKSANKQISGLPEMGWGSKLTDGQNFLFTPEEFEETIKKYPELAELFHVYLSAQDMLNNKKRYALYLKDAPLKILQNSVIRERVQAVRENRLASKDKATLADSDTPTLYQQDHVLYGQFIMIPQVSSEARNYVPMALLEYPTIVAAPHLQVPASLDLFALLQSKLHMAWLDTVGGKLEGRYRYSNTLVYNTFVVPDLADTDKEKLTVSADKILKIRENYSAQGNSLADMYDPLLMPTDLRRAHQENDKLVDSLYNLKNPTKEERVAELMRLYEEEK
ncbi:MAG: N-6 DNA methylase [Streptococcaceae bacterium]|jgi:hypothetical protein|nr:N-6 DNA methylase [Streptococcaceae bacterium]